MEDWRIVNGEPARKKKKSPGGAPLDLWPRVGGGWGPLGALVLVGVLWWFCHQGVLLPRLLLGGALSILGGGLIRALRPAQTWGATLGRQQETETENSLKEGGGSLGLVLADCLLLCVLQENLQEPNLVHIQTHLCRLEALANSLRRAEVCSQDLDSALKEKLELLSSFLQQRTRSLAALVLVQGQLEAGVGEVLGGLGELWLQLEELHTGVTLTPRDPKDQDQVQNHQDLDQNHQDLDQDRRPRDLALARTGTQTMVSVLHLYRSKIQTCQAHLERSTQLLQELAWSHAHLSHKLDGTCESVWPELLLQSNIEQVHRVQEDFISLQQQTSTFQAHLEGLGGAANRERPGGGAANRERPGGGAANRDRPGGGGTSEDAPHWSKLQLTSAFTRLRTSGRKKKK